MSATAQKSIEKSAAQISVSELNTADTKAWDDFVEQCKDATFFHLSGWKNIIEKAFAHPSYFYFAERDGRIEGVLPLVHVKSRLFGNALISTPFCVYGGIAATTEEAHTALREKAIALAENLNVDHLELRNINEKYDGWITKELYVTYRKAIDPDPEVNMKAIPRKQRAMVRKGIKAGLESQIDNDMDRFYEIYAVSVRNHGTPVFSKKYFNLLKETFGEKCEVSTVVSGKKAICSVVSFYFRDEVLPYYGGGLLDARQVKGFDFMYWKLMERVCRAGVHVFDYGRSKKGTGSYSFKKNWGFEPTPLNYQYYLVNAKEIPDVNPLNPKYQLFIKCWKRLPLPVTKIVGPHIVKNLG